MRVSKEALGLFAIGCLDLGLSLCLISRGHAREANPLMAFFLGHGLLALAAAKGVLLIGPIAVLEWCRIRRPAFTRTGMRLAIATYVAILGFGCVVQPLMRIAQQREIERVTIQVWDESAADEHPPAVESRF